MTKPNETLTEYIKLIIESKVREANLSGNRTATWGSEDHIQDLQSRIADAEYWKNKLPRGSEKRAHYRNILMHLKNEMKSARRHAEKTVVISEKEKV